MTKTPNSPPPHALSHLWHPTDYLRVLFKRRWVALPGFLLVFLTGAIGTIRAVPVYEAKAQLLIEKDARRVTTLSSALDGVEGYGDDDFYPTQYNILASRTLALRTSDALSKAGIAEKEPASSGGFAFSVSGLIGSVGGGSTASKDKPALSDAAEESSSQSRRIDSIIGNLKVDPIRMSRLVNLRFRSTDPQYAAQAVNMLAQEYRNQALDFRLANSKEAADYLAKQLVEYKTKVQESEATLQRYKETHNTVSVDDKQNIVVQRLQTLNSNLTAAELVRSDKEEAYNQIMILQKGGTSIDAVPAIRSNEAVIRAKAEIATYETKDAELAAKGLGPKMPDRANLAVNIKSAKERLKQETDKAVENVRSEYTVALAKEADLKKQLERQTSEVIGLDKRVIEYAALAREADSNKKLYENLLERTKESGAAGEFKGSNVTIVDKAEVPRTPVLPQVKRDLLVAAFGGCLLAFALAFGFEYIDSRIKTPDEVKAYLGMPCLGMVPVVPIKNQLGETPLLNGEATAAFSEAIRAVRTAVLFASADEGARSIVVTSTGPHEGKTLVASSLAIALAQTGQRTIVLDADMRRPRMHQALGRSQEPGLSNLLVGESTLTDAVRPTTIQNLWILPAGHIPPNPAELLGSKKYDELLAELKRRFDTVIVDAPPVMPVTDAALLAHTAGGVLFVIGAEMTPRQSAAAAIEQLTNANAKFLGAVLNRVHIERHAYYYSAYYHKAYGKYYQQAPQSTKA
jgi:capsular exopolysaccharide synthesis family protein